MVPSELHMQLVEKNGVQFFHLTHTFASIFLDQAVFEDELPNKSDHLTGNQWSKDLASWTMAREDMIRKLKKNHCEIMDAKREFV